MQTQHYEIPLPQPDNDLEEDVARLRNALHDIDELMYAIEQQLGGVSANSLKWDGSPVPNPAAARASLQLGSAAVRPSTDFATAHQGDKADGALQANAVSAVGQGLIALPAPAGARFLRVNANGSVSPLTAAEFLAAIGAVGNPLQSPGDLIVGGAGGVPTKLSIPGTGVVAEILAVSNGALGYYPQNSNAFDFGRWTRGRTTTANVSSNPDFNIDLEGGIHVSTGADYWISTTTNQGTHPVWEGFSVANYRLQDFRIAGGTGSSNGTKYQIAIPNIESEAIRDNAYLQIRFKQNGESSSETWGPWKPLGGSSGGELIATSPVQTFTNNDAVSNVITADCDCNAYNFHLLNFRGSPFPTNNGSFVINLNNLPDASEKVVSGHIQMVGGGRKPSLTIQADGYTMAWLAAPTFQAGMGIDLVSYYISPLRPTTVFLSLIDSRS